MCFILRELLFHFICSKKFSQSNERFLLLLEFQNLFLLSIQTLLNSVSKKKHSSDVSIHIKGYEPFQRFSP